MAFAAVQFLFWRVFMRLDYQCPPHLTFTLDISKWTQLVTWSRQALEWLDTNDSVLDTVFIYPYAATSCALVQYHTWARRGDLEALDTLKKVKGTATRWERIAQPGASISGSELPMRTIHADFRARSNEYPPKDLRNNDSSIRGCPQNQPRWQ